MTEPVNLDKLEQLLSETAPTPWIWERTGLALRASIYSVPHLLAKTACEHPEDGDDDTTAHLIVTAVNNLEPLIAEVRQLRGWIGKVLDDGKADRRGVIVSGAMVSEALVLLGRLTDDG